MSQMFVPIVVHDLEEGGQERGYVLMHNGRQQC